MIGDKATVQLKQSAPPKISYRIRISDLTNLDLLSERQTGKYADELCAIPKEDLMVRRIWRADNRNVTATTNFREIYDEWEQWVKKLDLELQLIPKENWVKLVAKSTRMRTIEEVELGKITRSEN